MVRASEQLVFGPSCRQYCGKAAQKHRDPPCGSGFFFCANNLWACPFVVCARVGSRYALLAACADPGGTGGGASAASAFAAEARALASACRLGEQGAPTAGGGGGAGSDGNRHRYLPGAARWLASPGAFEVPPRDLFDQTSAALLQVRPLLQPRIPRALRPPRLYSYR